MEKKKEYNFTKVYQERLFLYFITLGCEMYQILLFGLSLKVIKKLEHHSVTGFTSKCSVFQATI